MLFNQHALLIAVIITFTLSADTRTRHAAFIEAGGSGFIYSINYELQFHHCTWFTTGLRAGLGYCYFTGTGLGAPNGSWISIPVMATSSIGYHAHYFEFGIGYNPFFQDLRADNLICYNYGYRFQAKPKGVLFRVGYTPFSHSSTHGGYLDWFGASIGWVF